MIPVKPKKSLGQHFLTDRNIAEKIVNSLLPAEDQVVLEIGPGMGVLTGFLLEKYREKFFTIDVDEESIRFLTEKFPGMKSRIIQEDFLRMSFDRFQATSMSWIGNLPYNISSPIFFRFLENRHQVSQLVCMIQKEVAERIAASSGSKTYGILSVLLQAYFHVDYLFTVNEQVFSPPPKVKSAVIRLSRKAEFPACDFNQLLKVVKTSFNQRRKILRNALSSQPEVLERYPEILQKRAEQLTVEDFIRISC